MRKPLYNAVLQNALDADGHGIQNIASENLKQVWISSTGRTDGQTGTGTRTDPYDGSTQPKLDAVFQSYYDAATTDIVFHLSPGTFYSQGTWDNNWGMLSGWHIKGAGKTLTRVVQVVGALGTDPGSNGPLFAKALTNDQDNQSLEDLWCDCAWFRSGPGGDNSRPHGNFSGVILWGENACVRNVKVTGAGWADNECFAIFIVGGNNDLHIPHNAIIENCEVSEGGSGPNLTGMAMVNNAALASDGSPTYAHNGRVLNNIFNIPTAGNAGGPPGGFDSGIVSGNTFIGYYHGIFYDTYVSKGIVISNNVIEARYVNSNGILFNAGAGSTQCADFIIIGNTIRSASSVALSSACKNFVIAHNRILLYPGNAADASIFLNDATVANITVSDNIIDSGIPIIVQAGATAWLKDNRTPAGALIIQNSVEDTPTTLFVSQAFGNATTATRLKSTKPYLTINAAIAAASSGDTIDVMDGTFNERLNSKNGVTVRFRPQAKLVCTTDNTGCIQSTGTSQTFAVYHEHTPILYTGDTGALVLWQHASSILNLHASIHHSGGGTSPIALYCNAGTVNIWGNVTSDNHYGVGSFELAGEVNVWGNISGTTGIGRAGGLTRVFGGKIIGTKAIEITAASAYVYLVDCNVVSAGANGAIHFTGVGSFISTFRNCVLCAGSSATEVFEVGASQTIRLYGHNVGNKGDDTPTNVTFEGGGTYAQDSAVIPDLP